VPTCPGWAGPPRPRWNWDFWTAQAALELGLEVWLSPELWDHDAEDTLAHVVSAARVAEELRHAYPGRVYLSVGSELCLFMRGIIPGGTVPERIARPDLDRFLRAPATQESLNEFLARAAAAVRLAPGFVSGVLTARWRPAAGLSVEQRRRSSSARLPSARLAVAL
jgi:hypothetical protein